MKRRNEADPCKGDALRLADEVGPAEASRQTGVPASTIRMWRSRAKAAERNDALAGKPREGVDPPDWWETRERTAQSAATMVREAIATARRELKDGKPLRAQQAMVAAGIACDKLGQLEAQLAAAGERTVRIGRSQAEVVASLIEVYFEAAGLPFDDPARRLLANMLRQATAGELIVASPADSEPVHSAIRKHVARELRAELEAELREQDRLALPPPDPEPVLEPEPPSEPEASEPVEVADAEEVTEAEVVEDPVAPEFLCRFRDPVLARHEWQRRQRAKRRDEAERGQPFGTTSAPSRWRGIHDMPGGGTG